MEVSAIPPYVQEKMAAWRRIFMKFVYAKMIWATATIVVSGLAASQNLNDQLNTWLPVAAAMMASLTVVYSFNDKASGYKAAWRTVDLALLEYLRDPSDETLRALYDAVARGEEIIKRVDF